MKLDLKKELPPKKLPLQLGGETADLLDQYVAMVHEQEQIQIDERVIAEKILAYALSNDREFRKWRTEKAKAAKAKTAPATPQPANPYVQASASSY